MPINNKRGEESGRSSEPSARYLTTREAADYLRLSPRTLEKKRIHADGPPYCKLGSRVVYSRAALDEWVAAQTVSMTGESPSDYRSGLRK